MTVFDVVQTVVLALALGLFVYSLRPSPPRGGGYRGGQIAVRHGAGPLPVQDAPPPRRTGVPARLVRERWVVTLKSGAAFVGVLYESTDRVLILREAEAVAAGENGTPLPVDGELILFVADVAYAQRP